MFTAPIVVSPVVEQALAYEYVAPEAVELTVEQLIIKKAAEYGVDPDIALSIAYVESGFKNIDNRIYTENYYSATGIFQIVKSTYVGFCGGDAEDRRIVEKNIDCAMYIMSQEGGLNHWSESYQGWKNLPVRASDIDSSTGAFAPTIE